MYHHCALFRTKEKQTIEEKKKRSRVYSVQGMSLFLSVSAILHVHDHMFDFSQSQAPVSSLKIGLVAFVTTPPARPIRRH